MSAPIKYVPQSLPASGDLRAYLDQELRKIQNALGSLDGTVPSLVAEAWTDATLVAPWTRYDAAALPNSWYQPRFFKDQAGIVHISGLCKSIPTALIGGSLIFNLPVGYRPGLQTLQPVLGFTGGVSYVVARIDIFPTGDVIMQDRIVSEMWDTDRTGLSFVFDWLSLNNLHFRAEL